MEKADSITESKAEKKSLGSLGINIRDYGMFIALFVIVIVFSILTGGTFTSPRNISNLLNQTGYIAVIAVSMTLIIVIRHIDLSVGFLSGFLGAVAATLLVIWNMPIWVVIPLVLLFGIGAGLLTATPVAKLGIPAFVASLAGWLIYRGALLLTTLETGTISIRNDAFNAIGNGFIPDIFASDAFLPEVHKFTALLGIIAIAVFVLSSLRKRRNDLSYDFEVSPMPVFIVQTVFVSALIATITWLISMYNGMSWTLVIVLLVVGVYSFITQKTVLGRHIYAVGGNPEAAELSGINVSKITFVVFASNGLMAALSGILYASRLQSASPQAGTLLELDAIAAAFIGGVSAGGGVGSVVGALIGALVYTSLTNGMSLLGTNIALQYIIRGAVLVLAVIFDVATRRSK